MDKPSDYGPKMAALTELQRNYVKAMASAPFAKPPEWVRMAGYSDGATRGNARVYAHRLKHDPKVEAAVFEYASQLMHTDGPLLAVQVMLRIARDNKHPKQLAAAEAIANRVGLHEMTEHKVKVEHSEESAEAKVERIKQIAALLGVDVGQLLGRNAPKLIKGQAQPESVDERADRRPSGAVNR
jgi:hypothetical protein